MKVPRAIRDVAAIALALVLWQVVVSLLNVPAYLVPRPTVLLSSIGVFHTRLLAETGQTLLEAAAGFVVGNGVGLMLAAVFARSALLERTFLPWTVVLKTIPIVAITPLLTLVLGYGAATIVVIAALISFFPALMNGVLGFRAVNPQALELLTLLHASEWRIFWALRWPSALPYVFAAFRVSGPASILAAMVAEWAAANAGLGYLILDASARYQLLLMWDGIVVATALAVAAFVLVEFAEGRLVGRWARR